MSPVMSFSLLFVGRLSRRPVLRLSRTVTWYSLLSSERTSVLPMKPVPPVTNTLLFVFMPPMILQILRFVCVINQWNIHI